MVLAVAAGGAARGQAPVEPAGGRAEAIVREMPLVGTERALGDAYEFVRSQPGDAAAQHLWTFIGDVEKRQHRLDRSAQAYAAARALGDDTRWGRYARLGLAEVLLVRGRYGASAALYASLVDDPDPAIANVAVQRVAHARRLRDELFAALGAATLIALVLAADALVLGRAGRAGVHALIPAPVEIKFAAPIVALLALGSLAADRRFVVAFAAFGAGWLVIAWMGLSAASAWRAVQPARRSGALALGALVVIASAAALYLFIWAAGMMPALGETLMRGADR